MEEKQPLRMSLFSIERISLTLSVIGILSLLLGLAFTMSYFFLPTYPIEKFAPLAAFGDFVGGTIGTGVAIMNMGAFLVLTYAIGAAQQKSHEQQLKLQNVHHEQEMLILQKQHEENLRFHKQAQIFPKREQKLKELREKYSELYTALNSIQEEVRTKKMPQKSPALECSIFSFYLDTDIRTLFANASIEEASKSIKKHGRIMQHHSITQEGFWNHDMVLNSLVDINKIVSDLVGEMDRITYEHLL